MPLFASLTLVKETALKEAASLKSPLLTSFIEKELLHIDLERLAGIQFPEYYSKLASDTIIQNHLCICNRGNKQVSSATNP